MSKIRIKNFGPIKDGYLENDGWLDIKKVSVFIGNQGSGKSTVAKLISSFMWLEKAIIRGDINNPVSHQGFIDLIEFHRLQNYLETNTEIEYEGATYHLKLVGNPNSIKKSIEARLLTHIARQPEGMRAYTRLSGFRSFCLCTTDFILVKGRCLMPRVSNNCFNFCSGREHFFTDISCSALL